MIGLCIQNNLWFNMFIHLQVVSKSICADVVVNMFYLSNALVSPMCRRISLHVHLRPGERGKLQMLSTSVCVVDMFISRLVGPNSYRWWVSTRERNMEVRYTNRYPIVVTHECPIKRWSWKSDIKGGWHSTVCSNMHTTNVLYLYFTLEYWCTHST